MSVRHQFAFSIGRWRRWKRSMSCIQFRQTPYVIRTSRADEIGLPTTSRQPPMPVERKHPPPSDRYVSEMAIQVWNAIHLAIKTFNYRARPGGLSQVTRPPIQQPILHPASESAASTPATRQWKSIKKQQSVDVDVDHTKRQQRQRHLDDQTSRGLH